MSKQSIKSKSQHLATHETLILKGKSIEWEGNGVYVYNKTAERYIAVHEMKDLEFKMTSQNYGAPIYVRKDMDGVLVWFNPAS